MASRRHRTPQALIRQLTHALDALAGGGRPEQAVRARAHALLAYLADVPVAILVANNRSRYVDANQHAVSLTGYPRAELLSMGLFDLTPNPNQALGRRLWRAFLRRGRMAGQYPLCRKDGSIIETTYLAIAHVLPGVHVSALVPRTRPRVRRRKGAAARPRSRKRP